MKTNLRWNLSLLLLLSGCVHWVAVNGPYTMASQNFEVVLPDGWKRNDLIKDVLVMTRDGVSLQEIRIARRETGSKMSFTQKKIDAGMLPQEAAEVLVDNLRSNPNILNLQVKENIPATIAGHPGFKLVYVYKTQSELTRDVEVYGVVLGKWYYLMDYDAPARHYFERDLASFEKVKDSFKLVQDTGS